MAEKSEAEQQLKPLASATTMVTKIASGAAIFLGAATVTLGAFFKDRLKRDGINPIAMMFEGSFIALTGLLGFHAAQGAERAKSFVETEEAKKELVAAAQKVAANTQGR